MITRYSRPEMQQIWSEENKYESWLEVELLATEAWSKLGVIPEADAKLVRVNARINIDRILEIEQETRHDVVAFTRAVAETLGEESKWVHYGLTSTDVVDTALSYRILQANKLIEQGLTDFLTILKNKALEHKHTMMMGRTHGVHAEPTTFGLKLALWYEEMRRNYERFKRAADVVQYGKISGAVGTYANTPPAVEEYVCEQLGLKTAPISTQTLQRDRHAEYIATLALIASSLEKFAIEIRSLQRTEIREVEELFASGQKGSSAMPHKRNPIGSENITGLARVMRGYMLAAYEDIPLWHERDISHSSVERIIIPDATTLIDFMLQRFGSIVRNLTVFPQNMRRNMDKTYGLIYSQQVLLALIKKGMSREAAYDLVQSLAMKSWDKSKAFREIVLAEPQVLSILTEDEVEECFNPLYHLQQVEYIFERLGLVNQDTIENGGKQNV
jgi:adenylosuccinate lyase